MWYQGSAKFVYSTISFPNLTENPQILSLCIAKLLHKVIMLYTLNSLLNASE